VSLLGEAQMKEKEKILGGGNFLTALMLSVTSAVGTSFVLWLLRQ
jgi:hypothetical protein